MKKTQILVDGNCIVCDLEVSHYKKIAPDQFEIVDISSPQFDAKNYGLTTDQVNRHLHVIGPSGEVLRGVDSFLQIWSQIPRYRFLKRIVGSPVMKPLAELGYSVFVEIRPWLPKKSRAKR